MNGRHFKRLLVAAVFAIIFMVIAKVFLGETLGYLGQAASKKKTASVLQPASAPAPADPLDVVASAVADTAVAGAFADENPASAPVEIKDQQLDLPPFNPSDNPPAAVRDR